MVPYSSSSPWIASTGQRIAASSVVMFHARNAGSSQMSFQPQNAESGSSWYRASRALRSVVA